MEREQTNLIRSLLFYHLGWEVLLDKNIPFLNPDEIVEAILTNIPDLSDAAGYEVVPKGSFWGQKRPLNLKPVEVENGKNLIRKIWKSGSLFLTAIFDIEQMSHVLSTLGFQEASFEQAQSHDEGRSFELNSMLRGIIDKHKRPILNVSHDAEFILIFWLDDYV